MSLLSNVLVIKLGSIGDVVHTLPAVAALKESYPEAGIDWLVEKKAAVVLKGNPALRSVIEVDTRHWRKNFFRASTLRQIILVIKTLRSTQYDLAIDFQGLWKSAIFGFCAGARELVGFDSANLREPGCRLFYQRCIKSAEQSRHVIEKYNDLVRACNVTVQHWRFDLPVPDSDKTYIDLRIREHGLDNFVIINPGGGWPTKNWETRHYGELVRLIQERIGIKCVLTWGPGEDRLVEEVKRNSGQDVPVAFPTTLLQFVALASRASLFVGGDTGPMHLAAACGTPVVAIFGPTDPARNGPWSPDDLVVYHPLSCGPCYKKSCETVKIRCLKEVPVAEVYAAVELRWEKVKRNS
jgi:heptosyltransferase I